LGDETVKDCERKFEKNYIYEGYSRICESVDRRDKDRRRTI
jgi:hypothetical protein